MSAKTDFQRRLRDALDSPTLGVALDRFLTAFRDRRAASFEGRDFAAGRDAVVALKQDAIERLPELIAQFTSEAEQAGAVVHLARDAAHARRIIGGLALERGVKLIVKGKSMATEEIALNPHLEQQGIEVVETDLGEWIIQLAHEHPSHLIAPAIHHTRETVAELFTRELGEDAPPIIEELVGIARRRLREAFITADMGITGANAAIAESGTLVLVSNEGNGRLVSTLPPIHVAVLGVEKIVPTLEDATAILQMLPRSATGQKLSSYVSFITGPSRTGDIELSLTVGVHGPKEVHIVLLDNGRMKMRQDPDARAALQCIRCAACSNVCPAYQVVGGHAFGHVYTGPIGLVLTPWHHGLENAVGPQSLCMSCNACETVCPAGIPLPRMIMDVRQRAVEEDGLPWLKRAALDTFSDPPAFTRWMKFGATVQGVFPQRNGLLQPPMLPSFRSLPVISGKPLNERMGNRRTLATGDGPLPLAPKPGVPKNGATGMTVSYFPGCITNWAYPDMGETVMRALEALGAQVVYPSGQWCCGLPALNAGDRDNAVKLAQQTIETLEDAPGTFIVTHATSCAAAMVQDYLHLFRDQPAWLARAQRLSARLLDFAAFMEQVVRLPDGALAGRLPFNTVTYHDACQSHNALGRHAEQRRLLSGVLGLKVAEMQEAAVCCGFGGGFSADHPEVSARVLDRKLGNVEATGATVVVTDNPGCILQLRGGLDARGSAIRVAHLAELLAAAMDA